MSTSTATTVSVPDRVRVLAFARLGLGASMLLVPGQAKTFLGDVARAPAGRTAVRMVGVRDVAIGLGQLIALERGAPVRGWVEAGGLADAGDLAAGLLAWRSLPKFGRVLLVGFAAAGAVGAWMLASELD
jgi:hypothetical protein